MNSASKSFQFSILLCSGVMICGAAALWVGKTQRIARYQAIEEGKPGGEFPAAKELLIRSYRAENQLSYSALSNTIAYIGDRSLESTAQLKRAPHRLSIKMISGPMAGVQSGYSNRWFWRQEPGEALQPYAEVKDDAAQVSARRFGLLLKNYTPTLVEPQTVSGRPASVVELWPVRTADGAKGPARRLYIDRRTGLTLRVDSFNCDLKPTARTTLSHLNLSPQVNETAFESPEAILTSLKGADWRGEELGKDFQSALHKTGFKPPTPTVLPPGFELDGYGVHRCRTTGTLQKSAFTRYTDGLNSLTIFAFKPVNANIAKNMRGICNFGPGALSSREDNGGRLVAVGDLPVKTLQRVLVSAKFETAR